MVLESRRLKEYGGRADTFEVSISNGWERTKRKANLMFRLDVMSR
jgi:hypothetical protein